MEFPIIWFISDKTSVGTTHYHLRSSHIPAKYILTGIT